MARLNTPFGYVSIMIDGQEIEYCAEPLKADEILFPDIAGRYKISVMFEPDGKEHALACILPEAVDYNRGPESGERLECQGFYSKDRVKLSIGLECEAGYLPDGTRWSNAYDYDADYLENGMAYLIEKNTKSNKYVFGVAWIDNVGWEEEIDNENDRDVQTWFAADPTIM